MMREPTETHIHEGRNDGVYSTDRQTHTHADARDCATIQKLQTKLKAT